MSEIIGRPEGMTDDEWDTLGVSLYRLAEDAYKDYMESERGYKARFAERTLDHWLEQLTWYLLALEEERNNNTTFDEVFDEAWGHIRRRYNEQMIKAFSDVVS